MDRIRADSKYDSLLETKPESFKKGLVAVKGKTNTLYQVVDHPDLLIFQHGDTLADNDSGTFGEVPGKGRLNNELTEAFATLAQADGLPTHFIRKLNDTERLVKSVKTLSFEVIVRNIAAGSFADRLHQLGIRFLMQAEDTEDNLRFSLHEPLIEVTAKSTPKDVLVADGTPVALGWITSSELKEIKDWALRINGFMAKFFHEADLVLVDFKLEFGHDEDNHLVICDEFSFDTCRLHTKDGAPLDKTAFFSAQDDDHTKSLQAMQRALWRITESVKMRHAQEECAKRGESWDEHGWK